VATAPPYQPRAPRPALRPHHVPHPPAPLRPSSAAPPPAPRLRPRRASARAAPGPSRAGAPSVPQPVTHASSTSRANLIPPWRSWRSFR